MLTKIKALSLRFPELKIGLVFLVFFLLASFLIPRFFALQNLAAILVQMSPVGVIAVGMTFVIITGGIDLSVGSLVAMISVLMAGPGNYPLAIMLILAFFWGAFAGAVNGGFIGFFKISPFIVTLSTMAIAKGVALWVSNSSERVVEDPHFAFLGGGSFLSIPLPIWIFVITAIVGQIILSRSVFGKRVYAVGSNPIASEHAGIPIHQIRFWVYLITGILSAVSALIISARLNISTPTLGEFYELDAIAAVIIGGTSLFGGRGSVVGTVIGVLIFGVITNVLNLSGTSPHMQRIVKGVVILIAVLLQTNGLFVHLKSRLSALRSPRVFDRPTSK